MENRDDLVGEFGNGTGTVGDWGGLKTVEFVELVVYRGVAVEVLACGEEAEVRTEPYAMKW